MHQSTNAPGPGEGTVIMTVSRPWVVTNWRRGVFASQIQRQVESEIIKSNEVKSSCEKWSDLMFSQLLPVMESNFDL